MLNKVMFIGRLGRDPEVKYMGNGDAVCNFSIAASERWKDKESGEQQESTEWLRCTAWRRLAEVCGEYLKQGSLVYVEGKLKTRKYEDKDGVERSITECQLSEMKMLGSKSDSEGGGQRSSAPAQQQRSAPKPAQQSTGFDNMDDDIPF